MATLLQKNIIWLFWSWYYGEAPKKILKIWQNYVLFMANYFSIPLLLKTLFAPWRMDITPYKRGFVIREFFYTLTMNLISRILGAIVRIIVIVIGIAVEIIVVILGGVLFVLWLILPLLLIYGIIKGIIMI